MGRASSVMVVGTYPSVMVVGDLPNVREEMKGDIRSLLKASVKTGRYGCCSAFASIPACSKSLVTPASTDTCLPSNGLILAMLDTISPDDLADSCSLVDQYLQERDPSVLQFCQQYSDNDIRTKGNISISLRR